MELLNVTKPLLFKNKLFEINPFSHFGMQDILLFWSSYFTPG